MLYPTSRTPAEVIGRADAQTTPLAERLWAGASDAELLEGITALEDHVARLGAVRARMLAEIASRELPRKQLSWGSTGDWYAHLAGLPRRAAHRTVRHVQQLTTDRGATLQALTDGTVSEDQAGVICDAVDTLPTNPALRERAEACLLGEAAHLDATQLAAAGRRVLSHVDPDHDERRAEAALAREERAAHLGRELTVVEDGVGGVRVRGHGSLEDGAVLRAALLPLTKPVPEIDPEHPDRAPEHDPRDHGARMWDAVVALAQHCLDTDLAPESHGARPRLSVLIGLDALREGAPVTADDGAAMSEDGLRLSHAAVRRLACDADVIPVCLGGEGEVLDVGRRHRLVTTALWHGLIARDRHCAFPGCTRPPLMCHAHHVRHWADGGPTSLDNLVMLCGHHHRAVHDTAWRVRLAGDGRPEFLPPPRRSGDPPPTSWTRHRPRRE